MGEASDGGSWRVADANTLRRATYLTEFLGARGNNVAVITDFCCMECYKGDPLVVLPKSLAILSRYARQVVVLRSTGEIALLTSQGKATRDDLVDLEQTGSFAEFCSNVAHAAAGNDGFATAVRAHGTEANAYLSKFVEEATSTRRSIAQVIAALPAPLAKRLRSRTPLTSDDILVVIDRVAELSGYLFARHPEIAALQLRSIPVGSFVFRYSLAVYLLALSWAAMGGIAAALPQRIANDMVDMNYVAFATLFDGVLSHDAKVNEIYDSCRLFLDNAFVDNDNV